MKNNKMKVLVLSLVAMIMALLAAFTVKAVKATWYATSDYNIDVWNSTGSVDYVAKKGSFKSVSVSGGDSASGEVYVSSQSSVYAQHSSYLQFTVGGRSKSHGFETGQLYYGTSANSTSNKILSSCSGDKSSYTTMDIRFYFNYGSSSSSASSVSCSKSSSVVSYYIGPSDTKNYINKWFTYEAGFDYWDNDFKFTFKIVGDGGTPTFQMVNSYPYSYDGYSFYYLPSGYTGSHSEMTMSDSASGPGAFKIGNNYYKFFPIPVDESACGSSCTVYYYDKVGNRSSQSLVRDITAPTISNTKTYTSGSKTYFNDGETKLTFSDTGSGLSSYRIDKNTSSGTVTGSSEYSSTVTLSSSNCGSDCTVYVYDQFGFSTSKRYYRDNDYPTSTGTTFADNKHWFKSGTRVDFADATSGFNYYKIGSGSPVYTPYLTLTSSNCGTSCTVYIYDNVGRYGTRTFYRDDAAPTGTASGSRTAWSKDNQRIELKNVSDSGSGLASAAYCLTTSDTVSGCTSWSATNYYSTFADSTNATYYIYAKDKLGNTLKSGPYRVMVDKTVPYIDEIYGSSSSWATSRSITIYADDDHSGLAATAYYCNGAWQSSNICTYNSTTRTDKIKVRDVAGNESTAITVDIYVDASAPTASISGDSNEWATSRTITITASDPDVGLHSAAYYCKGAWQSSNTCTYSTSITTDEIKVRNALGTETIVSHAVNIYVDNVTPTHTVEGTTYGNYFKGTLTIKFADDRSGFMCYSTSSEDCNSETSNTLKITDTTTIHYRDKAGNYAEEVTYTADNTAPTITIEKGEGEISTDTTYLTVNPIVTVSDAGSGVKTVKICKKVFINSSDTGCKDKTMEELNEYKFASGYLYEIYAKDNLNNETENGAGKSFYMLVPVSTDSNVSTVSSYAVEHMEATTITLTSSNVPGMQFDNSVNANFLMLVGKVYKFVKVVSYDPTTTVLSSSLIETYGIVVSIDELIVANTNAEGEIISFTTTALATAEGQAGTRALAFQFCSDESCTNTTDPGSTDGTSVSEVITVSAPAELPDRSLKVVAPVTYAARKATSESKLLFIAFIIIITFVAIELIVASKLKRRKAIKDRYYY